MTEINELIGKSFESVTHSNDEELIFNSKEKNYKFYHSQDCCESVYIEDICSDLNDLENTPILEAEEISSNILALLGGLPDISSESYTWTFYKFRTNKGSVTVR